MATPPRIPIPVPTPPLSNETQLSDVFRALVGLLETGSDPAIIDAQRILLRRLALQGDVVSSRIPAPRNITEIGGYLNLVDQLQQPDTRAQMIAGALGVAGPTSYLGVDDSLPIYSFVSLANDRPEWPGQPASPTHISLRGDFVDDFVSLRNRLHDQGCYLPLWSPPRKLPSRLATAPDYLACLGRTLQVLPAAVLSDPDTDPLAIAATGKAEQPLTLVARELDNRNIVSETEWTVYRCDDTTCKTIAVRKRFVDLKPLLANIGWNPQANLAAPASLFAQGGCTRLVNVCGLNRGITRLGDELELVYPASAIVVSAFSSQLDWLWDGQTFVAQLH